MNRKVHAGFGPADGGSTLGKPEASTPSDWYVCAFEYQGDAERFYRAMVKRLKRFGLELSAEKTRIMTFDRKPPRGRERFEFLGFEFYWGTDRGGKPRVKRRTSRKNLRRSIKRFTAWCKENLHLRLRALFRRLNAKLRGYYKYYGVIGNYASLKQFFEQVVRILHKWLNRRSQRRSYTWPAYKAILKHYAITEPRINRQGKTRQLRLV